MSYPSANSLDFIEFVLRRLILKPKQSFFFNDFSSRGYPDDWLETALNKIRSSSNNSSLKEKNVFSCIFKLMYSPLSYEIKRIANTHWHIIQSDKQLQKLFYFPYFLGGNASLTDILVLCLQLFCVLPQSCEMLAYGFVF